MLYRAEFFCVSRNTRSLPWVKWKRYLWHLAVHSVFSATVADLASHFARSQIADQRLDTEVCALCTDLCAAACVHPWDIRTHCCSSLFFDRGREGIPMQRFKRLVYVGVSSLCCRLWRSFYRRAERTLCRIGFCEMFWTQEDSTLRIKNQSPGFVIEMPLCAVSWIEKHSPSLASQHLKLGLYWQWGDKPVILIVYVCFHCQKHHKL